MFSKQRNVIALVLLAVSTLLLPISAFASGTSTPEEAVSTLIKPLYSPGAGGGACDALSGKLDGCPLSARLLTRLQHPIVNQETGNLVGRNQNPPQSVSVAPVSNDGQTAQINTVWQYGASSYTITFAAVKQADGWVVDDSYCAGNPSTSIYNAPVGPCPSASVPGLPNTGAPDDLAGTLVRGVVMLAAGVALVGRSMVTSRAR
jgi:hypothetical protein